MKSLNGSELAGYIKQNQLHLSRSLVQAHGVQPRLAIIRTNPDPVVDSYMKLKQSYGQDIGVEVDVHTIDQAEASPKIAALNKDDRVHGIIVQIPLPDKSQTVEVLNSVAANKDVDGLAEKTEFDPATPMAINWLLAGYNIQLVEKNLLIIGHGRLVGSPLAQIWRASGLKATVADRNTPDLPKLTREADVIVTATGVAGLVTKDMVKADAIIVDAGVATDKNGLIGDVAPDVRELPNITITPEKGGVGPLTVCALFENVLRSARRSGEKSA